MVRRESASVRSDVSLVGVGLLGAELGMRRVIGMDIGDCSLVYALSPTMASGGGSGGGGGTGGFATGVLGGCET